MRAGWIVRARVSGENVRAGDLGEIRTTGLHEHHLVYWHRQKATSYFRGTDLERIQ